MNEINIPEGLFPIAATVGAVTFNGGVTCDNISLKNIEMVWIHVFLTRTNTHNEIYTPLCGTLVATCATALPQEVPIWKADSSTVTTKFVRQTDAKNYTMLNTETGPCHLIFQIDPNQLQAAGVANDCLGMTIGSAGHADVIGTVVYWVKPRYGSRVIDRDTTEFIVD